MADREYTRFTIICFLFIILFSQLIIASALNETDEIVAGVPANFPPQYSIDKETGQPAGFAIDIMDEIARRNGLEIRYVVFDTWPEVTEAMREGQIDVIPNSGITDERKEYMDFTSPVEVFHIRIFTRSTTEDIMGIDDLAGRKVAVVSENKGLFLMEEYGKAELHVHHSIEEAFLSLISGNTDALVYPEEPLTRIARQSGLETRIKTTGDPLFEIKRAIALSKGNTELLDIFDNEVRRLVITPEYMEIYLKWYGEPEPYWNASRVAILMGILLILVIVSLVGWRYYSVLHLNRELRRSIDDRKEIERSLQEQVQQNEQILQTTMNGYILADTKGKIINVNPAYCTMVEYSREELLTMNIRELEVEFQPEEVEKKIENTVKKGTDRFETRHKRKDGKIIDLDVNTVIMDRGEKSVLVAFVHDITQKKRSERELIESEKRVRSLIETAASVIIWLSPDFSILEFNPEAEHLYGVKREDVIGRDYSELFLPEEVRGAVMEDMKKVMAGEVTKGFENSVRTSSGERILIWNVNRVLDSRGHPSGVIAVGQDITERKHLEDELRDSEKRYRLLFESNPQPLWVYDLDTLAFLTVNDAAIQHYGYSRDEFLNMTIKDIRPEEDIPRPLNNISRVTSGIDKAGEWRHLKKDGTIIDVEIVSHTLIFEGKRAELVMAIDITERKKAREIIKKSEGRLAEALKIAHIGSWEYDLVINRLWWSDELYNIFEIDRNELEISLDKFLEFVHPDDRPGLEETVSGKKPYRTDYRIVLPEKIKFIHEEVKLIKDESGKIIQIVGTAQDITKQKQAEEEIKHHITEMEAIAYITEIASRSLEFDKLVQNVLPVVSRALETEPVMLFMCKNEKVIEMRGFYGTDKRIKQEEEWLEVGDCLCGLAVAKGENIYSEDINKDHRCTLDACKHAGLRSFAAVILRTSGKNIGLLALGSAKIRNFAQQDTFLSAIADSLAIAIEKSRMYEEIKEHTETLEKKVAERTSELQEKQDAQLDLIHELNITAEELKNANQRLQELDRLKSMFIASTSHELRTPLNSIIGFSSIMLEGWSGELNPEQKEQISIVLSAGKQLLALINDIIDISKLEAGKLEVNIEDFRLGDLVDEAMSIMENEISEKGLVLTTDVEDITLISDRRRVFQCLMNLLSNAIKFTEKGKIEIKTKSIYNEVQISIIDTGIGIKQSDIVKLFGPFVRLESPLKLKTTGTGLGLYITKKLAEEVLGGTIDVKSEYGKGSRFTLHIPLKKP